MITISAHNLPALVTKCNIFTFSAITGIKDIREYSHPGSVISMQNITLDNGLTLLFTDTTRRYYGNFFRVRIVVSCCIPLMEQHCPTHEDREQLRSFLGEAATYERTLEKMGVPEEEIGTVRDHLVAKFLETSAPYLSDPAFPQRYIGKLSADLKKKGRVRR
jgi:hypothetical protein